MPIHGVGIDFTNVFRYDHDSAFSDPTYGSMLVTFLQRFGEDYNTSCVQSIKHDRVGNQIIYPVWKQLISSSDNITNPIAQALEDYDAPENIDVGDIPLFMAFHIAWKYWHRMNWGGWNQGNAETELRRNIIELNKNISYFPSI